MKAKTNDLKELCTILANVIKEDKVRPITELVQIFEDGVFGMTDTVTRICGKLEFEGNPITGVIKINSLLKLVKLTTKEYMTLELKEDYIAVTGNGKYKIPLETDQGSEINLKVNMPNINEFTEFNTDIIKTASIRNKISMYVGESHPEYAKYYSQDGHIITSDGMSVAVVNGDLFEHEVLPFVIEQLNSLNCDKIQYAKTEKGYYIKSNNISYYTKEYTDNPFPAETVLPYVNAKDDNDMFPSKITISKKEFTGAIKRLDLFKSVYGIPCFSLTLSSECAKIENTQGKAEEILDDVVLSVNEPISIKLETDIILKMLRSMEESITIYVGEEAIILEDTIGLFVVSKLEE